MRQKMRWGLVAVLLIIAPTTSKAQFETLRFVDVPPVGSWAEYQVSRRTGDTKTIVRQTVSLVASDTVDGQEYLWFQVQTQSDSFGSKRTDVVYQVAIARSLAEKPENLFRKIRELVVQVGDRPAFRIPQSYLQLGVDKNLLVGGSGGAGSDVDYAFRDLGRETLTTGAGDITCTHQKGAGKAEVVMSMENPVRHPVDSIQDLWIAPEVPFGLVKRITKTTGDDVTSTPGQGAIKLDSEEIVDLMSYGTGAQSSIRGQVVEYSPAIAGQLRPSN